MKASTITPQFAAYAEELFQKLTIRDGEPAVLRLPGYLTLISPFHDPDRTDNPLLMTVSGGLIPVADVQNLPFGLFDESGYLVDVGTTNFRGQAIITCPPNQTLRIRCVTRGVTPEELQVIERLKANDSFPGTDSASVSVPVPESVPPRRHRQLTGLATDKRSFSSTGDDDSWIRIVDGGIMVIGPVDNADHFSFPYATALIQLTLPDGRQWMNLMAVDRNETANLYRGFIYLHQIDPELKPALLKLQDIRVEPVDEHNLGDVSRDEVQRLLDHPDTKYLFPQRAEALKRLLQKLPGN